LDALLSAGEHGDPAAVRQFVGLVTTKFTGFFRHPAHFVIAARRRGRGRSPAGQSTVVVGGGDGRGTIFARHGVDEDILPWRAGVASG
jgi:hypothetical protein